MNTLRKPIPLRIIFILNALMMVMPFIFYYVFTTNDIKVGELNPTWMLYTGLAYILSFALLVFCILNKNLLGLRIIAIINILIAIPVGAYIGILIAIVTLILSFNKKVTSYFINK